MSPLCHVTTIAVAMPVIGVVNGLLSMSHVSYLAMPVIGVVNGPIHSLALLSSVISPIYSCHESCLLYIVVMSHVSYMSIPHL
jgi:hypothetical protein